MATVAEQIAAVVQFARAQLGQPYVWGGESRGEGGFDCSGLSWAAYRTAGVQLPRTARAQYAATRRVSVPQPGDLVFFGRDSSSIHHVGIYIGNGLMIDAPTFGKRVSVNRVASYGDYYGATRPLAGDRSGFTSPLDPVDVGVAAGTAAVEARDALGNAVEAGIGKLVAPLRRLTVLSAAVLAGVGLIVLGGYRAVTATTATTRGTA
jgi:hypothetical protein